MDNVDHTNLLSSLLEKKPKEVKALIQDIFSESKEELKDVNWLGLAEVLASKAQESLRSNEESLAFEWGEIAISIYQNLANKAERASFRNSLLNSSMMLRAKIIKELGSISGDSVFDIQIIIDWFLKSLMFSYEDSLKKLEVWEQYGIAGSHDTSCNQAENQGVGLAPEDALELRHLKNRLAIIKLLVEDQEIVIDESIMKWVEVSARLP